MTTLAITRDVAWAIATDVGNEHMRMHGRKVWNEDDYYVACDEFNRLIPKRIDGYPSLPMRKR